MTAPISRRAGVEPSVPPVAAVAEPSDTRFRISPAWGSLSVAVLMLGTVALLAARSARNARAAGNQAVAANQTAAAGAAAAAGPAAPVKPVLAAELRAPTPTAPVVSASPQPSTEEPTKQVAPVDVPKSKPLDVEALPPATSAPPGLYLRVGLGWSCPEMLTFGRQFLAVGMADSKVVQLKSRACALVRGPYAADVVQQRRKEHNDRHIRGLDTAVVVDGSDFDKWLPLTPGQPPPP